MRHRTLLALTLALFLAVSLTACADPQAEQRERFHSVIHDVDSVLTMYVTIDPQGTAADAQATTDRLASTWEPAREAAAGLEGIDTAATEDALADLVEASEALPADMSAREAIQTLSPYIERFSAALGVIHDQFYEQ